MVEWFVNRADVGRKPGCPIEWSPRFLSEQMYRPLSPWVSLKRKLGTADGGDVQNVCTRKYRQANGLAEHWRQTTQTAQPGGFGWRNSGARFVGTAGPPYERYKSLPERKCVRGQIVQQVYQAFARIGASLFMETDWRPASPKASTSRRACV